MKPTPVNHISHRDHLLPELVGDVLARIDRVLKRTQLRVQGAQLRGHRRHGCGSWLRYHLR